MISYFNHQEIDKVKWDNCIAQSNNELIYAYSWYLDSIAPGWAALVLNDYEVVMPLPIAKKYINSIYQPFFAQQLGVFNTQNLGSLAIKDFIEAIPPAFKYVNVCLNEHNIVHADSYNLVKRKNYVLHLHRDYETLFKGFNDQNKRNIRKALSLGLSIAEIGTDAIVDFYKEQKGPTTADVGANDYERFKMVLQAAVAKNMCKGLAVVDESGQIQACAAFYIQKGRIIFQVGTANQTGRTSMAMFFLMNHVIKEYSNQELILDFEGSDIENVARFFGGFGAYQLPYYRLIINRLPWFLRWLKK